MPEMLLELNADQRTVTPAEIEQRGRNARAERFDELCKLEGWTPQQLGRVPMDKLIAAMRAMNVGQIIENNLAEWVREYVSDRESALC